MGATSHRGGLRAAHPEVHKMPAKERHAAAASDLAHPPYACLGSHGTHVACRW
jgi:hypothetical protein